MAQFLGDIAWMLELFAIASGLVLLHVATIESHTKFLQAAGWLLVLGGLGTALCTGYYWFSYRAQGHFDVVHARTPMPMSPGSMAPDRNMGSMHRGVVPESPPGPEEQGR